MADYLEFSKNNPQFGSYLQTEYAVADNQAAFDIYLLSVYLCEDEDPKKVERLFSLVAGIYRKGLKDGMNSINKE